MVVKVGAFEQLMPSTNDLLLEGQPNEVINLNFLHFIRLNF